MKASYDYGLSKIYELVINGNPAYAFLLDTNSLLHNKFVAAHVFGHTDFFKHNIWFERTNRQMVETVSLDAQRIRQYGMDEGSLEVERFLDAALSIAEHVDPYPRHEPPAPGTAAKKEGADAPYGDLFPSDGKAVTENRPTKARRKVPPEPEKDLLRFLLEHADHLEDWQRDILAIVREESLYFVPQMQTKIMNEGWASFWHNRIMRALDLSDDEFLEFSMLHSSVCTPGRTRLNPYYVGLKIFEDIERRFGRAKLFEVRELESDVSFIRSYLTEELSEDLDLFKYKLKDGDWKVSAKAWEQVRDAICESMTNFGYPYITVDDGDFNGRRELYLRHHHDGRDLDVPYAERTLKYVQALWGRPVYLETMAENRPILLKHDGEQISQESL